MSSPTTFATEPRSSGLELDQIPARLAALTSHPGPYLSAIVTCDRGEVTPQSRRWYLDQLDALMSSGATEEQFDAVAARLELPVPDHAGGRAVYAARDGYAVADVGDAGPVAPLVRLDGLPYAAPLVEWDQSRVPHLVVTATTDLYEADVFLPHAESRIVPLGSDPVDAAAQCREIVRSTRVDLAVLAGEAAPTRRLEARLLGTVPIHTHIRVLERDELPERDGFADAVARLVSDRAARETVAALEEFRFLREHRRVFEGVADTLEALSRGIGGRLLVHDDPHDHRRAFFGDHPSRVSASQTTHCARSARMVDVAIWSALGQGIDVRIVPSTPETGPAEDIGLLAPTLTTPTTIEECS